MTDERGYTLIEILIGLTILSIVSVVLLLVITDISRRVTSWQSTIKIENQSHLVLQQLCSDLRYAVSLAQTDSTSWIVGLRRGREIHYSHVNGQLTRNGRNMYDRDVSLTRIVLDDSIPATGRARQPSSRALTPRIVQITAIVTSGSQIFELTTAVKMRQSSDWPPLDNGSALGQ